MLAGAGLGMGGQRGLGVPQLAGNQRGGKLETSQRGVDLQLVYSSDETMIHVF